MKQPRRIFQRSIAARSGRVGRTVLVWTAAAFGVAAILLVGQASDLFGHGQPMPDHLRADAGQVAVVDGETLALDGHVIRLAGIEAPVRGDTCPGRPGHEDQPGTDCGGAATSALASLVRDRHVDCQLSGHDRFGRPYAACDANGTDLSRAIVAAGWARAQPETPDLADLELRARRQGAGLWAASATH
jgi:endonuclease YncB( thermonuclease family)